MKTVENISKLEIIGETKTISLQNGDTITLEDGFVDNLLATLQKVETSDGEVLVDKAGIRFVPSFDSTKSENELIVSYSLTIEKEKVTKVKLTGKIDKQAKTINVTGEGFGSVTIDLNEYIPTVK